MNVIDLLLDALSSNNSSIQKEEKYSTLDIEYQTSINSLRQFKESKSRIFFELLKSEILHDSWTLTIVVENSNPATLGSYQGSVDRFCESINDALEFIEDENIHVKLHIEKRCFNGIKNIYSFQAFDDFVGELRTIQFLDVINEDLQENKYLKFRLLESEKEFFYSRNIFFYLDSSTLPQVEADVSFEAKFKEHCFFGNYESYPYSPRHFNLIERPSVMAKSLMKKLDKLAFIFAVINIFDITSFNGDTLRFKLNGYKTIEGRFSVDTDNLDEISCKTYLKICEWIYSESGNITEKIGLARNILSIYLNDNSLQISEDVYFSIQSGFKTYLQENLNRYLQVRSNISEQLAYINQKANNAIEKYLNDYQKSSITFVSFFISILVFRVLGTGDFVDAFTKDATILSFSLLAISLIYLLFSLWNLNEEKRRLKIRYKNLKGRFQDLLIKEDIERILQDDQEFKDEINFINRRSKAYTALWIITVLIILFAVLSLSSYFNWASIFNLINGFWGWMKNFF